MEAPETLRTLLEYYATARAQKTAALEQSITPAEHQPAHLEVETLFRVK